MYLLRTAFRAIRGDWGLAGHASRQKRSRISRKFSGGQYILSSRSLVTSNCHINMEACFPVAQSCVGYIQLIKRKAVWGSGRSARPIEVGPLSFDIA